MAVVETWLKTDLKDKLVKPVILSGAMFTKDNNGNRVGVEIYNGGEPASVSGTVSGNVICADHQTFALNGVLQDGYKASVLIPQAAYDIPGQVIIIIKLTSGTTVTTVGCAVAYIQNSIYGAPVDPGTIIPSIADLIDAMEHAESLIPADKAAIMAAIAPTFSPSWHYQKGNFVWHDGTLYEFTYDHSGNWNASHAVARYLGLQLTRLSDSLKKSGISLIAPRYGSTSSLNGIDWISYGPDGIHAEGTSTDYSIFNLFAEGDDAFPKGIEPGGTYFVTCTSDDPNLSLSFYYYKNGEYLSSTYYRSDTTVTIPSDATGMVIRVFADTGKTVDGTVSNIGIYQYYNNEMLEKISLNGRGIIPDGTDLDTIREPGTYVLLSGYTYTHAPFASNYAGCLVVYPGANPYVQTQVAFAIGTDSKSRTSTIDGGFHQAWRSLGANEYNYYTENYNNTYNITCNPTITTDTNNYLASTGDSTDRTGAIQTMLNTTGVCRLGPGDFYITGVEIPAYGMLIGSGQKSCLVLADSVTTGYAVRLKTYGCVKDLRIRGTVSPDVEDIPSTIGTRHGILFEGTADAQENPSTYYRSVVENCMVYNFTGGGITLRNTGLAWSASLLISDCSFHRCGVGVYIPYFSEFSRITNVRAQENLYGCIDNGGNNNFANCDFSGNTTGLLIYDDPAGTSRNNTHGSFVGCTFNHSGGNSGTAIRIENADHGEIFTAAQIFYGSIEIINSIGIRFIGANIGPSVPITITDSKVVSFNDCTFYMDESSVTQSTNVALKFTECYMRNGTVFDPMD